MKSSLNKINGNYLGSGYLYEASGIHSINKHYNRMVGTEWIRPSEWLPFPNLSGITQTIVGLVAIIPGFSGGHTGITSNSNFLALRARPAYIVDWGDGTTGAFADLATASKQYNYYSLPNENLTAEGYKQVIVRITPQGANNLTYWDWNVRAVIAGVTLPNGTPNNWLEVKFKTPFLNNSNPSGSLSKQPLLKSVEFIGPTSLTTTGIVSNFNNLENIGGSEWSRTITSGFGFMFVSNRSLKTFPLLESRNATTMVQMTNSCHRLQYFPPLDTTKVTSFNSTFYQNYSLDVMPYMDTSLGIDFLQMHFQNFSLKKIPNYVTTNGTNFTSMLRECYSLKILPSFNLQSAISIGGAFTGLYCVKDIPEFNTSNVRGADGLFRSVNRPDIFPDLNLTGLTATTSAVLLYANIETAWKIGIVSFNSGFTSMNQIFAASRPIVAGISCGSLSGTTFINNSDGGAFFPRSVRVAPAYGAGATLSYLNCSLSPTALNNVFNGLATLSGVCASINITGNWGSSGCNRSLATSKGWTVIG
jgi:hypothetical protein